MAGANGEERWLLGHDVRHLRQPIGVTIGEDGGLFLGRCVAMAVQFHVHRLTDGFEVLGEVGIEDAVFHLFHEVGIVHLTHEYLFLSVERLSFVEHFYLVGHCL